MSPETQRSAVLDAPPRTLVDPGEQASRVIEELDDIVGQSRRRSRLRRALHRVGDALAKSLDRMVPPTADAPADSDPPPRFPFF